MKNILIASLSAIMLGACATTSLETETEASSVATITPNGMSVDVHEGEFADIQTFVTPGGTSVWLVSEPSIPIVAVNMAWKGGRAHDPEGLEGLAGAVVYHMNEGAGDLDSLGFQTRMEELNMSFGCSASLLWTSCSVDMLSENADEAMALVASAFENPTFDSVPFERFRREQEVGLKTRETSAGYLAQRAEMQAFYPGHTIARETSAESIAALTPELAKAHMRKLMVQDRLIVTAVGDISPDALAEMIDNAAAGMAESSVLPDVPEIELPSEALPVSPIVVDLEQPQSLIQFTGAGMDIDHPDFYSAYVLNYEFGGGGFASRLMQSLRVEKGLTYGIYTRMGFGDIIDEWGGGGQTKNESAGEFIEGIEAEMTKIAANGITEEELSDAKAYLTGSYPLGFDSNSKIASQLMNVRQDDDRDITYFDTRNAKINAVTLEDVNRVASEWLTPDRYTFIVVGQPQGLSED